MCSSPVKHEVSLAQRGELRGLPGSLAATSGSLGMEMRTAVSFAMKNITMFEARSILCAVRYAQSCRLPTLSDNLALVLALCKGRSTNFTLLSVVRRIFASGVRAGFVLSCKWIPSELNIPTMEGASSTVLKNPNKKLVSVLARRLTRSSRARTCDEDCLSP